MLDRVKQTYHFGGTVIHGTFITVDVYAILCEVKTQLRLACFRVMVSLLKRGSEAYGFVTSVCSEALSCCSAVLQK